MTVWKSASSYSPHVARPMTWLMSIARNRAIDSLRRARTQPQLEAPHGDDSDEGHPDALEQQPDDAPGPLDLLGLASQVHAPDLAARGLYRLARARGVMSANAGAGMVWRRPTMPSMDGNTVELSREQVAFAENAVAYSGTLNFLRGRIETITRAIKGE